MAKKKQQKFNVSVTEILSTIVRVKARDESAALRKVKAMWSDETIVLSGDDFQDKQIEIEDKLCEPDRDLLNGRTINEHILHKKS
ncbi:MAG TPA: hypothetical protein ENH82_07620 [bacterium]|nr:hypothetical protein [bacterium]